MLIAFAFISMPVVKAASITGRILDENKKPLSFVNISLTNVDKPSEITGVVTGNDGSFFMSGINKGKYTVSISFVGYFDYKKGLLIANYNDAINWGTIVLKEDKKMLDEVQVVGQASQMRFDIDKKVFNVDQNLASSGASATEVLKNIPSVDVDNDGNISLRNNTSVEVWINGKPSGLTSDNRAEILEQMPAGSIQSVEVITNPSAKYNPEGTAGIINIVLKKDRKAGHYGSVSAGSSYQWGYKPTFNASGNFNYNSSKIDAYANIGLHSRQMRLTGNTDRYAFESGTNRTDTISSLFQNGTSQNSFNGLFARLGLDYHINNKQTVGVAFMGFTGARNSNTHYDYATQNYTNLTSSTYYRDNNTEGGRYHLNVGLTHTYEIDTLGSEIQTSLSFSKHHSNNDLTYAQTAISGTANSYNQKQTSDGTHRDVELKSDLTKKFGQRSKLEAGVFASWDSRQSPSRTWNLESDGSSLLAQYNDYNYSEWISGLYGTYGMKIDKFSFQGGLRGEYTRTFVGTRDLETDPFEKTVRQYLELYPTAFISYSLPNGNELQLNYTRRINRPRGRQLNAMRNVSDSTNVSFGNPLLNPEFSTSMEFNYIKTWKDNALSASMYYRYSDNMIQQVRYLGSDGVMYTTYDNIAKQNFAGLEVVSKNKATRWLNLTTTVNVYYSRIEPVYYDVDGNGTKELLYDAQSSFSTTARLMANFILGRTFSGQITGNYNSPQVIAQGVTKSNYAVDMGLRKTFADKKFTLSLSARNILNSFGRKSITWGDNFWQDSESNFIGPDFNLTFTYNFGNMRNQKRDKNNKNSMQDTDSMDDYSD